jgi:hypothetical protein
MGMKRLASIIAATAAAAAVASAISLPAGADGGAGTPATDELATFTSCLRAHGLAVPDGLDARALKAWMGEHEGPADFAAALDACNAGPDRAKPSDPAPEDLVACLGDHGLTAPATIDQLKPWIAQQSGTEAGKAALTACGFAPNPVIKDHGGGGCAGDKPAAGAKAARAKAARAAKAARGNATPAL